jgi:hypothetical protein
MLQKQKRRKNDGLTRVVLVLQGFDSKSVLKERGVDDDSEQDNGRKSQT